MNSCHTDGCWERFHGSNSPLDTEQSAKGRQGTVEISRNEIACFVHLSKILKLTTSVAAAASESRL